MTMHPRYDYDSPLTSAIEPGIKVESWAFDEDPCDNQRPVDDFFTINLNYIGCLIGTRSTTGTLKLKRESGDWQFDIMGWLAELNVDVNAWDCTINVVVESCESLLRDVRESGRKSLEIKVEVYQKEVDYQEEVNYQEEVDYQEEVNYQEEVDYQPMYSDDIHTECIEEDYEPMCSDTDDIKYVLQDSGVRFANGHSGTMNNCSICLEEFGMSNNVATLACFHIYHEKCMVRWVFQGKRTCPLCRLEIKL